MTQKSEKRVLIVVDMQNDFITGSLGSRQARAVVEPVCARIRSFDGGILYTMDTHGADYLDTQEGRRLPVMHCVASTDGWALNASVEAALAARGAADEAHRVGKPTFGAIELPTRIRAMFGGEVEELLLVGLCTDICVISNAMLLKAAFTRPRIVVDAACCAGVSNDSHLTALAAMRGCQIDVIHL